MTGKTVKRSGKKAVTRLRLEPKGNLLTIDAGCCCFRNCNKSRADLNART